MGALSPGRGSESRDAKSLRVLETGSLLQDRRPQECGKSVPQYHVRGLVLSSGVPGHPEMLTQPVGSPVCCASVAFPPGMLGALHNSGTEGPFGLHVSDGRFREW